jgi:carbon monoxide dehydrogenase subunit G
MPFRVRAEFKADLEIAAGLERVRAFFGDLRNFADLMPDVENIEPQADGAICWFVCAEVALIGSMRGAFRVVQIDDSPRRIEWGPAAGETVNMMRYAISFEQGSTSATRVRLAQRVELKRSRASELHMMAGLMGERRISAAVEEHLAYMMSTFLKRARHSLER